ncbi:MAG TPA: ABC transporter permease, partial [Candidatus Hydrogenedentes bacterium]|nr:ABC transporter permease [Candidatus Hydrogenedentota bacterium]
TFIFSGRVPVPGQEGTPFAVSLLCGLIFWQFTAAALTSATQSLIDNQNLVKKVHFAREVVPIAATGYPLVNLGIGLVILVGLHLGLGGIIGPSFVYVFVVFSIHLMILVGLALLLAVANVIYRDIGYMVGVAVIFGFYASPVFYPLEFVTRASDLPWYPWLVRLYLLNPMAELLTAYRQVLFEGRFPDLWLLAWPAVLGVCLLAIGAYVSRRVGPTLSDYL